MFKVTAKAGKYEATKFALSSNDHEATFSTFRQFFNTIVAKIQLASPVMRLTVHQTLRRFVATQHTSHHVESGFSHTKTGSGPSCVFVHQSHVGNGHRNAAATCADRPSR